MPIRLKFTTEAKSDAVSIVAWYHGESAVLSERFNQIMNEKISSLRTLPTLYPVIRGSTRRLLLNPFPYDLYYRYGQGEIIVIAILHQHRSPRFILQRLQKQQHHG